MVYRRWDVTNAFGQYRSTDYVISDAQDNAIQCFARSNISHCFISKLEERKVFKISKVSVVANEDKYRIRNGDAYVIRFPFQLIELEEIHANDSTYLIDVMGCAIDVGTVRTTKSASELLECQLINERTYEAENLVSFCLIS